MSFEERPWLYTRWATLVVAFASLAAIAIVAWRCDTPLKVVVEREPKTAASVTATPEVDVGDCGGEYGGPYPFGGKGPTAMSAKEKAEKHAAFELYKALGLDFSQVIQLNSMDKLRDSIIANHIPPNVRQQQKYNYVITTGCKILVAVWKDGIDLSQDVSRVACAGDRDGGSFAPQAANIMIDWAPEEPYGRVLANPPKPAKQSPCWLDAERKNGILDAISKHFMLAQVPAEANIINYDEKEWTRAHVAYAGEILVDINTGAGTCTYIVTENSGTYRPQGKYRPKVNEWFAEQLPDPAGPPPQNVVPNCPP